MSSSGFRSQGNAGGGTPRQVVGVQRARSAGRAVGSFVPQITRKAFEKYGFSAATLIMDWAVIIGPEMAEWTAPERLKWPKLAHAPDDDGTTTSTGRGRAGATLVLRVDQARALDVQYKSRQILERINSYFGYAAIAEIRIVQGPVERSARPVPRRPAPPAPLTREVSNISDAGLRAALASLGASIRAGS